MSVYRRAANQSDEAPKVPRLSESMRQGKNTGTGSAKPNPDGLQDSMRQAKRANMTSPYKETLGRTMRQGGSTNK